MRRYLFNLHISLNNKKIIAELKEQFEAEAKRYSYFKNTFYAYIMELGLKANKERMEKEGKLPLKVDSVKAEPNENKVNEELLALLTRINNILPRQ